MKAGENYAGTKISVIGAGVSGVGLALLARRLGARVFVSEERAIKEPSVTDLLRSHGIAWEEGGHSDSLFDSDLVLVGSGVSPRAKPVLEAMRRGITVRGELDFVAPFIRGKIAGVTGSNGKSTTTALTGYMLQKMGYSAEVAGNIGKPLAGLAFKPRDYVVVELSSFQLHWNTIFSCDVAMVTNLAPDHIDWHGSYEEYIAAKAKILQTGTPERSAIVQESELGLLLGERNPGFKLFAFSWGPLSGAKENMIIADDAARIVALVEDGGETRTLFSFDEVPMIGRHNIENAAFAAGAVHLLTGCGTADGDLFKGFKGLPHRCEFVATVDGVDYVDDSKGTNVAASATALASLSRPKVVILGGQGKGEDYAPLAEAVKREALAAVVLGSEREKIVKALRDAGYPSVHEVASMEEAVALSARLAPRGGLVLLSPACTSWDMYSDYKQRGLHFRRIVQALKDEEAP